MSKFIFHLLQDAILKSRGNNNEFAPFTMEGVLKDFVEFEEEIDKFSPKGQSLKNALKIENWCKANFGNKEIWDRKLPNKWAKDEEEKRLKTLQLQYDNGEIDEEDILDEDMDKLIEMYEKETEELNKETENIKIHISHMLKELKN